MQRYKLTAQASDTAEKSFETFEELEQFLGNNRWRGMVELVYFLVPTQYGTMDVEVVVGNWDELIDKVEFAREHGKWFAPTGDTYPL
jgi:hypothetical protein